VPTSLSLRKLVTVIVVNVQMFVGGGGHPSLNSRVIQEGVNQTEHRLQ
jgi:hypothetical protein